MKLLFAALLVVHGLIHLMGPVKAFKLAALPQLTQAISPPLGVVWLVAAMLWILTVVALALWPRWWWAVGVCAVIASQWAIGMSWADAKFGSIPNGVAVVGIVFGFVAQGPVSLRAAYEADVDTGIARLAKAGSVPLVTAADLATLPVPVQRYLRAARVVGGPRVQSVRVKMHGRIRSGPEAPWMPFTAEQYNFFDQPSRHFYMDASRGPVPFQGYHRYVASDATMRVKVAALVPVVDAGGPDMTQAETVTMFNDMCVLAPATLVDPAIVWEPVDARVVRAAFTNAGRTIHAELVFNDAGELVDFVSDDRRQASADGKTLRAVRWSTPVGDYRAFGPVRLSSHGEGRWHEPAGEYAYIEVTIDAVTYGDGPVFHRFGPFGARGR